MMLLDSNIIIYATKPEYGELRRFLGEHAYVVSAVSMVEVLGFHRLVEQDRKDLEDFFAAATILPVSDDVVRQAIKLRQAKKASLGDALVAATALVHGRKLVTRNAADFDWIAGLEVINPFDKKTEGKPAAPPH